MFFLAILTPPVLDQALGATELLFEGNDVRESAKKVLVVFTDTSSGLDENVLRSAASKLESKDVEVIGVAIESDAFELGYITPHTGNVIDVTVDENPDKLSSEILTLILTGLSVTWR